MDPGKAVGKHSASEIRDDAQGVEAIAEITGLAPSLVSERLQDAAGNVHVRNLFRDAWPVSAVALGGRTVAFAREHGLHGELRAITRATSVLVARRLNASHGKRLLRNAFWDYWPEDENAPVASGSDTIRVDADLDDGDGDERACEPNREIRPGTRLSGRYDIREQIGRGGFGTTWLAHDLLSGLELVIKIPHAEDGGAIRNELQRAFRIVHPNICQAFPDRDDDTGLPFLVMQHGGEDLARWIARRGGSMPLVLAVHVLVSIADALDYLHEQLVLHLDVSPGNILVDDDEVIRLTDFGASSRARMEPGRDGQQTRVATEIHSLHPCYAAPEVRAGMARSRTDQYSLFRVFCSLLEGRVHTAAAYEYHPFGELTAAQNAIVARALSYDPDERFASCAEPARALADDLARAPSSALVGDVARLVDDFVLRVDLELRRLGSNTVRLGGALKLGRSVERLLRAILVWMGSVDGFEPLASLREIDPHATSLDRTTCGNLVKAITHRANSNATSVAMQQLHPFVSDLAIGKHSRIWSLINARNDVVHDRRPADAILPAAAGVAELLRELRRGLAPG